MFEPNAKKLNPLIININLLYFLAQCAVVKSLANVTPMQLYIS